MTKYKINIGRLAVLLVCCWFGSDFAGVYGFGLVPHHHLHLHQHQHHHQQQHVSSVSKDVKRCREMRLWESQSDRKTVYVPPEKSFDSGKTIDTPYAKIGDFVRYFDLDGGRDDGETLVGKISFFQKKDDGWLVELTELEDVGDGYYADYPSRKRSWKRCLRDLGDISPLSASFVRSENAYKVPRDKLTLQPSPSFLQYRMDGFTGSQLSVSVDVVESDAQKYNDLKFQLYKDAALYGLVGAILTDLFRGVEDALIYATGAVAGLGYLFFLSIKTDTVGSDGSKSGSNIANLRFGLPLLVLVGVSLGNSFTAAASDMAMFRTVSTEQFAAAMSGFLTYRIPLFVSQFKPIIGDIATDAIPTGSAGVALQMLKESKESTNTMNENAINSQNNDKLLTILLVSGPQGTGKTTLVNRLIAESNGTFVPPTFIDSTKDPVNFEQLQRRDSFLQVDRTGRFGLTADSIKKSATEAAKEKENKNIVVIDSSVVLAKRLIKSLSSDVRLVGVWVGLDTLDKFEERLDIQLQSGDLQVEVDETPESTVRNKLREIVKDIEYGVVSGVFEFTILNDNLEKSIIQLKEAADYCFK